MKNYDLLLKYQMSGSDILMPEELAHIPVIIWSLIRPERLSKYIVRDRQAADEW